jgi:hypothetical protein
MEEECFLFARRGRIFIPKTSFVKLNIDISENIEFSSSGDAEWLRRASLQLRRPAENA